MSALVGANLALRFALELVALAAVGIWGLEAVDGVAGWAVALGAVAAYATAWGLVVSPKARVRWHPTARFAVEVALWTLAALALGAAASAPLAVVFYGVALASGVLNHLAVSSPDRRRRS